MKASKYLMLCLVGAGLAGCGSSKPAPGVVAENWTTNTEQLGIKAIYPPRTNVEVGDLFIARAVKVGEKISTADYVLASTKFDYINIDAAIVESRPKHSFQSMATYDDGSGSGAVTTRALTPMTINEKQVNSLVAFPGFTFASLAESDIGVNVTSSAIGAALGFGRRSKYSVSYSVPSAETYGAMYLPARKLFDAETAKRYTEDDLQRMRDAADQLQAAQVNKTNATAPVLVFVTDVYMTRALDVMVSSEDGMSGTFSAVTLSMVELSEKKKSLQAQLGKLTGQKPEEQPAAEEQAKPKPEEPKPGVAGAKPKVENAAQSDGGKASEITRINAELVQVNEQLRAKVSQIVPDMPGVTGSVVKSSALGITLRQAFAEPVVIGYRGIHFNIAAMSVKKPPQTDNGSVTGPLQFPGIMLKSSKTQ